MFALLQSPAKPEGAEHVFGGVYLINSKPVFEQTISSQPKPDVLHVYLGYAGWTQAQLQQEVELGAWFVFPAQASGFQFRSGCLVAGNDRKTEMQYAELNSRKCIGTRHTALDPEELPDAHHSYSIPAGSARSDIPAWRHLGNRKRRRRHF